jgi:hypothetical protein
MITSTRFTRAPMSQMFGNSMNPPAEPEINP